MCYPFNDVLEIKRHLIDDYYFKDSDTNRTTISLRNIAQPIFKQLRINMYYYSTIK